MVHKKPSLNEVPANSSVASHKPPRRIKSVSDALNLLGASVHSIFEKKLHRTPSQESDTFTNGLQNKVLSDNEIHTVGISFETKKPLTDISESDHKSVVTFADDMDQSSTSSVGSPESIPSVPKRRFSQKIKSSGTRYSAGWIESATADVGDGSLNSSEVGNNSPSLRNNENGAADSANDSNSSPEVKTRSKQRTRKGISFVNESDDDEDNGIGSDTSKESVGRISRKKSLAPTKAFDHYKSVESQDPHQVHRNVDDLLFDMFQEKEEEVVLVGNFLAALERTGLRKTDPRLVELFENMKQYHREQVALYPKRSIGSVETLKINRSDFKKVIADNIVLVSRAFRKQFVIPEFQHFCRHIEDIYEKCKKVAGGKNASYIPQLARINPNFWGVSICTIDGQRYSIGDTTVPFTLQSCSKPLTYAIALNELGEETVHQYVGQEPSGRMFNELVLDYNKRPHNPMVNAGAIIVISLLKTMVRPELTLAEKFDYTMQYFKRLGGGEYLGFNNAVFLSEREAADRNYALAYYMREHSCFPEGTNLKECLDYYFQVCSLETNCETSAVMAATLANGGICPVSGEKVLKSDSVRDVLSLMHSCGMYDYSGQFAFKVGLPAKSGVSGCILLVVPNVLGMCIWSPPLDTLGNTVRGVNFCQELVEVFNFHKYDNLRHASHKIDPRRHRYETKGLNIVNLLFAAASGDVTSMRRLHLSGMDMSAMDYDGRSAVHLAAAEGHLECVEYLLRHCGVFHKPKDRWGHLPLDDAERFGHQDVCEFLRQWDKEHGNENDAA